MGKVAFAALGVYHLAALVGVDMAQRRVQVTGLCALDLTPVVPPVLLGAERQHLGHGQQGARRNSTHQRLSRVVLAAGGRCVFDADERLEGRDFI